MAVNRHELGQINDATDTASRAESKATELRDDIRRLELKLAALSVACQAMWELIRDKSSLTENDIVDRIAALESKMGETLTCPQCGRNVSAKKRRCMFCSVEATSDRVFDV